MFGWLTDCTAIISGFFKRDMEDDIEAMKFLDHQTVGRKLKIERKAKLAAKKNLPAANQSSSQWYLTKEIKQYYEQKMLGYLSVFQKKVNQYRQAYLNEQAVENRLENIKSLPGHDYAEQLDKQYKEDLRDIKSTKRRLVCAENVLEVFRGDNNISDLLVPTSGDSLKMRRIILLAVLLVELGVNMVLFKDALHGSFGIGICVVLTILNGGGSLGAGYFAHYVSLKSKRQKFLGWIAVSLGVILLCLNLPYAHIREMALSMGGLNYSEMLLRNKMLLQESVASLLESPFGNIYNLKSIFFLLLGVIACAWSAWEGWKTGEQFPGFTNLFKEVEKQREDLDIAEGNIQENSIAIREQTLAKTREEIKSASLLITTTLVRYANFLNMAKDRQQSYDLRKTNCVGGYELCISLARDTNRMHRSDGAEPLDFSLPQEDLDIRDMSVELQNDKNVMEKLKAYKDGLEKEEMQIRNTVYEIWRQHTCETEKYYLKAETRPDVDDSKVTQINSTIPIKLEVAA